MKKITTLLTLSALSSVAFAATVTTVSKDANPVKVLTVAPKSQVANIDMAKVFQSYYKVQDAQKMLKDESEKSRSETQPLMLAAQESSKARDVLKKEVEALTIANAANLKDKKKDLEIATAKAQEQEGKAMKAMQDSQSTFMTAQKTALGGILTDISKAVESLAKERGYVIVQNRQPDMNTIVYSQPGDDLTEEVIKNLNATQVIKQEPTNK